MYYACLERPDGIILKMPFEKKEEAYNYVSTTYNELTHIKGWVSEHN